MKVIGITGGVGAGKSSVLALLKEMCSCDIIQADLVARNIYHSGNIGFKKVVDIFGEQIVGEDGEINRPLLADIIFKNPNKRIVLNSIIHPLVKQEIINQINNHKIAGDVDYCFVEAALLIEDHYDIFMFRKMREEKDLLLQEAILMKRYQTYLKVSYLMLSSESMQIK